MKEKVFFDDNDVLSGIVECSYFECKLSGVDPDSLSDFEIALTKELFLSRCGERVDEFVRDSKADYSSEDDFDSAMTALKESGFRSCKEMLDVESDALISICSKYLSVELLSELLPLKKTYRATFLVRKVSSFRFENGKLLISGLVQQ